MRPRVRVGVCLGMGSVTARGDGRLGLGSWESGNE